MISSARTVAPRIMKRAYHAARNLPDRVMHRRRHSAVQRQLSGQTLRTILVVCHGNICRSPYLHVVLQRLLPAVAVSSGGFVGGDRGAPEIAIAIGANRGLDLSRHRSRVLSESMVRNADLVIVMDPYQARHIATLFPKVRARVVIAADLDPRFESSRVIADPWKQSSDVFASSFDRLDRCAATLGSVLRGEVTLSNRT
jgi:protein-tyrosine phosphatase